MCIYIYTFYRFDLIVLHLVIYVNYDWMRVSWLSSGITTMSQRNRN